MPALNSKKLVLHSMRLRPLPYSPFLNERLVGVAKKRIIEATKQPQPLKYKLHKEVPESIKMPHPVPKKPLDQLPFEVTRSMSGNLPIYTDYKNQHVIKRTIVRKISGDVLAFAEELKKVVGNREVRIKTGSVVVPGIHTESITMWLLRLGL